MPIPTKFMGQKANKKAGSSDDKVKLDRTSKTAGVKSGYRKEKAKTGAKPKAGNKMASEVFGNKMNYNTTAKAKAKKSK